MAIYFNTLNDGKYHKSLLQSHFIPPAYEDGTDRVFRNVGIYISDAGELPKRKHNIFRTRRKFEIKTTLYDVSHNDESS